MFVKGEGACVMAQWHNGTMASPSLRGKNVFSLLFVFLTLLPTSQFNA